VTVDSSGNRIKMSDDGKDWLRVQGFRLDRNVSGGVVDVKNRGVEV
jgi:hypothetical protein